MPSISEPVHAAAPPVAATTVTIPGRHLDGPWADLVARVRSEGDPA